MRSFLFMLLVILVALELSHLNNVYFKKYGFNKEAVCKAVKVC